MVYVGYFFLVVKIEVIGIFDYGIRFRMSFYNKFCNDIEGGFCVMQCKEEIGVFSFISVLNFFIGCDDFNFDNMIEGIFLYMGYWIQVIL